MQKIRDKAGQEWTFDLNVGNIAQIKKKTGTGLFEYFQSAELRTAIQSDPAITFGMISAICQPQSPLPDAANFKGAEIMAMMQAWESELTDFTFGLPTSNPTPAEALSSLPPAKKLSDAAGDSPVSPESIPALSNSAN